MGTLYSSPQPGTPGISSVLKSQPNSEFLAHSKFQTCTTSKEHSKLDFSSSCWCEIASIRFIYGDIICTHVSTPHQPILFKFPELIPVSTKPARLQNAIRYNTRPQGGNSLLNSYFCSTSNKLMVTMATLHYGQGSWP